MDAETELAPAVKIACDIAAGRTPADPAGEGREIKGGYKNLNAKGNGPEWYRMVWRSGVWRYVSDDRMPQGKYLASERRCEVRGDVFGGELVAQHDRGAKIDTIYLIRINPDEAGKSLMKCEFKMRRDGQLAIMLPDGTEVLVPNPRAK